MQSKQARAIPICYFTDSLEPSGVGVHLLNLLRWLDQARYQVSFVCPDTPGGTDLLRRVAQLGARAFPLTVRNPQDRAAIARLRTLLRQEGIAIFHSQVGISWEGLQGLRTAYEAGVPVRVVTEHLPYLLTHPGQVADHRETTRYAQRVITVSEGSRRTFLDQGYPDTQYVCIHNGIEPMPERPLGEQAGVRRSLGVQLGAPLLLTVARLTPQKGHDVLLAAAPFVLAAYPQAQFLCVGEGPLLPQLEDQARALGVSHAVRFLGRRDDVPALLGAADLFVLPSRFEGHPLAALEALSAGLPVVGTHVCGLDEAVRTGETGVLVDAEQPAALAQAILALLPQRQERWRMGRAGRRLVAEEFGARQMARRTMDLYEDLLSQASS